MEILKYRSSVYKIDEMESRVFYYVIEYMNFLYELLNEFESLGSAVIET